MITLKLLRSYAAPGPAAICGEPNKPGTKTKARNSFEAPGFVVLPRWRTASGHRRPSGGNAAHDRRECARRDCAHEPLRPW